MNIEVIKNFIENNNDISKMHKNVLTGFIARAEQNENKKSEDRDLIERVANERKISEILYSSNEVKIYSVYGDGDWEIKFPIRSIFLNKKGVWERNCTVSPTFDIAYLDYLAKKYLGENTQFVDFALKMLEIKIED